jgi:uncharacterized protein involved in exopolysaccharide biosynthesis
MQVCVLGIFGGLALGAGIVFLLGLTDDADRDCD